jgi:hypothetical protein
MKRLMAMGIVMLSAAVAVQAAPTVYAEITFPTSTTWKLWLTETTNWDGNPADMTPGGLGIAGFCFGLPGATSGLKATPAYVNLETTDDPPVTVGSVGFSVGPSIANTDVKGNIQAFAGQDITVPQGVCYGFGVTAGSYTVPDANMYQTTGPYSWAAPGAPGSAHPGVLVFSGKRNAGSMSSQASRRLPMESLTRRSWFPSRAPFCS